MRISLKQNLLEMVSTLYQAHDEIRTKIENKQYSSAQFLINQCQECALAIGTTIEELEGNGLDTVLYIEEYCEVLYQIHKDLSTADKINVNKISKTLKKYLLTVEYSIKYDITSKIEVVFLPYKASMWDSLESVWKAADEDPECDAYVIPIPYYDKNPDGSLRNEHYEGNEFPANVSIIHYNNYDFRKRHPDAIFIHNPYDQYNYVTTVHPFFYTGKLRSFTDKLIYIPYYVSAEIDPYNDAAIEDRAGYVLSNGILNSDIVIVQSENTKRLFVNILERNIMGVDRSYWENKILGLGSPKFDRINSTKRNDSTLPEKWKRIIYKKNGVRKKTFFYNISVSTLLKNQDILEKIEDTLSYFQKNQDICLWWRPHPLYESTLASMRPELLEAYKKIVDTYKKGGWGIFDNGKDLDWAIAETDAYYGDSSSVINLYKEVKKPIMIQTPHIRTEDTTNVESIPIWPSAFYVDGNDIWFIHGKINILMRYDLNEKQTYLISSVPGEKTFYEFLYSGIYKWNDKLYLIPSNAREIAIFNIVEQKFRMISLNHIEAYVSGGLFCKIYSKGKYLFCIPCVYNAILKIDMETEEIQYIYMPDEEIGYINDTTKVDNLVLGIYTNTNRAMFFDLYSETVMIKCIGSPKREFLNINNIDGDLFAFDNATKSIIKLCNGAFYNEISFLKMDCNGVKIATISKNQMIIDPVDSSQIWTVDIKDGSLFKISSDHNISKNTMHSLFYNGIDSSSLPTESTFYFSRTDYCMYQFIHGEFINKFSMKLSTQDFYILENIMSKSEQIEIEENIIFKLKNWCENIVSRTTLLPAPVQDFGKIIFLTLKKYIMG